MRTMSRIQFHALPIGLVLGLFVSLLAVDASAQTCGAGQILLKNDILPDNPSGRFLVGVVPGVCKNEAVMSAFDASGPCKVKSVSVMFGHRSGVSGAKAVVDLEIYDGATFQSSGRVVLGMLLFKTSRDAGLNLQIQSHALNTYTLPKDVLVPSGRPIIGYRMMLNTSGGSCAFGFNANFCVDAANNCKRGINILDAPSQFGLVDPAVWSVSGTRLCPLYIRGSWIIRACVEPQVSLTWTGNPTPGGVVAFKFKAPGQSGNGYYALVSGGISTGWNSPWGRLPLDPDFIFNCFLSDCAALLINRVGVIGSSGESYGGMIIPNSPILKNSGLQLYANFVTFKPPNFAPFVSVSPPAKVITIN